MRSLSEATVRGKKVLVRVGFDVSLGEEQELEPGADWRIRKSLKTLSFLLQHQAKIILLTHLGRPGGRKVANLRVDPLARCLSSLLKRPVKKLDDCLGAEVQKAVEALEAGKILFLENLRFYPQEETGDKNFAKKLAALGDLYVNEAFSACHRPHASIISLPKYLPGYAGFCLLEEVETLRKVVENPLSPLVVLIGGVKAKTKIEFLKHFLKKADAVCLGGVIANTILHLKGIAIGKSAVERAGVPDWGDLDLTNPKLHLPVDTLVSADPRGRAPVRVAAVGKTGSEELILDIGPETVRLFNRIIRGARMIIWNGPLGRTEVKVFAQGTKKVAQAVCQANAFSILGGGDIICFLAQENLLDGFGHLSTGGGAMLEFLVKGTLPGIKALE